jgi:hypothetical protein
MHFSKVTWWKGAAFLSMTGEEGRQKGLAEVLRTVLAKNNKVYGNGNGPKEVTNWIAERPS